MASASPVLSIRRREKSAHHSFNIDGTRNLLRDDPFLDFPVPRPVWKLKYLSIFNLLAHWIVVQDYGWH